MNYTPITDKAAERCFHEDATLRAVCFADDMAALEIQLYYLRRHFSHTCDQLTETQVESGFRLGRITQLEYTMKGLRDRVLKLRKPEPLSMTDSFFNYALDEVLKLIPNRP